MKMELPIYIVDAFTDEPFKGNPAGVCIVETELPLSTMLSIAKELGYSETAFIQSRDERGKYSIRYFSPKMEIPLCGHATMASAKVLFEKYPDLDHICFQTIEEIDLMISRVGDQIQMEFPVYQTVPASAPQELLKALGIQTIINAAYNSETKILLLEIADSLFLEDLRPDYVALIRSHKNINGVLVTASSQREGYDFESRYFWPWSGTNEDPVTGGTHTFLTPYWTKRLGKHKMKSFQCSARSGFMEVELIGENKITITGQARILLQGDLRL